MKQYELDKELRQVVKSGAKKRQGWKCVAMVAGDMARAAEIARARVAAGDGGGYMTGMKTFFERALELCGA